MQYKCVFFVHIVNVTNSAGHQTCKFFVISICNLPLRGFLKGYEQFLYLNHNANILGAYVYISVGIN